MDHSGISMQTHPFGCGWDSGQVGFIYATRELLELEEIKDPKTFLENEVKTYNYYLTGECYGYIIKNNSGDELGACWGFYGEEDCKQSAIEEAEAIASTIAADFCI
jgi:hypothetical protein